MKYKLKVVKIPMVIAIAFMLVCQFIPANIQAQSHGSFKKQSFRKDQSIRSEKKLAPDLEKKIEDSFYSYKSESVQRVIIKFNNNKIKELKKRGMVLTDLATHQEMNRKFQNQNAKFRKGFDNFGVIVAELPLNKL